VTTSKSRKAEVATETGEEILARLRTAANAALDKKARGLVVLDVASLTSIADYFFICTAGSERQADAISDGIEETVRKEHGAKPLVVEGRNTGRWILMDYGDFVVHVFTDEWRKFYRLERLWGDATDIVANLVDLPATDD